MLDDSENFNLFIRRKFPAEFSGKCAISYADGLSDLPKKNSSSCGCFPDVFVCLGLF